MLQALRDQRTRGRLYQGVVLAASVTLVVSFVLTARNNLEAQGIVSGFGFLERSTGWDIQFSLIEYSSRSPYWRALLVGFLNTIFVGLFGLACASLLGLLIGLARISTNAVLNLIGTVYVEIFRNVPLLLQGFLWYAVLTHLPSPRQAIELGGIAFVSNRGLILPAPVMSLTDALILALAIVLAAVAAWRLRRLEALEGRAIRAWICPGAVAGVIALALALMLIGREAGEPLFSLPAVKGLRFVGGFAIKPEFSALVVAIAVFGGAYIGEIVRGGFLSVQKGQLEAARALGLNGFQRNWLVRIPLALRAILPSLANQYIWLMKATTIGIAIGYPDYFMVVSTSINQSGQTIELLMFLMGGFLLINYTLGTLMNRLNASLAMPGKDGR